MELSVSKGKVYIVIDPITTEPEGWEWGMASNLQGYLDIKNLPWEVEQVSDIAALERKFKSGEVKPKSMFIYPNAWSSYPMLIKHWSEVYKVKIYTFGFWSKGCFIANHPVYRPVFNRNWRKAFERSIHRSINVSFFVNEYFLEKFRTVVAKNIHRYRLKIGSFPMDHLRIEMAEYYTPFKKDAIVYPWPYYSDLEEKILYDLKRVFAGKIQVIILQEEMNLTKEQALKMIARCKVVMMPFNYPVIGKEFYEMFLLGVIPSVPMIHSITEFVPKEFSYDPNWTKSIFDYAAAAKEYTSYLEDLVVNFDKHQVTLDNHVEYLSNNYYNSEKIFDNIFRLDDTYMDYVARRRSDGQAQSFKELKEERKKDKNNLDTTE